MHPGFRWRGSLRWLRRTVVADPENWAADVLSAVLGGKFIRPGYRSQLITSVHSPTVEPEDLFVVRAAGDEASISLAAGQFLGSISAVLHRQLTHLRLWAVVIILVQVFVLAALIGHPASLILRILVYVFVVAALAPVVAVTVLRAAALPFGWDGPSCPSSPPVPRRRPHRDRPPSCSLSPLPRRRTGGSRTPAFTRASRSSPRS